ncbi:MAG: acyl-CoA dehydrogenase family protein [Rhodobacteraceae bacterium]|nr:acyl-CoA dehydrogenase family protein [Paracoccaceae bacterium]MCY4251503.1 acyl-CoA dehydrogenase family protein [Paracoccaceae bacterium]MCY4308438.1 acyl-CoA dehydrogenase family protein [Paracoccaceae bacterium]
MDFNLTEEQEAVFQMALGLGEKHISPHAKSWENQGSIPKDLWTTLGEYGLGGINTSIDYGGSSLKRIDSVLIFEALSMACPSVASFLSIHNMCGWMIDTFGSVELKEKYLEKTNEMSCIMSYCLTEPGSGSDAAAMATKAVKFNDCWEMTGTKSFISGGGYSNSYIVMCKTDEGVSSIIVDEDSPGLSFGGLEDKMGWRAQPTRQVQMDSCRVPLANLLGIQGKGFTYAMSGLDGGRLNIAACSLGGAQQAFNQTLAYMNERKAFGKRLDEFQALQFRIADIETDLQVARNFLRFAAWKMDEGHSDKTKFCAMAKRHVTDVCWKVANDCLQLHGGYGYLADYGMEKTVRDLRVHQILEGTNEIMRMVVFRELKKEQLG